ncbi:MAG TPA: UDP-N-acetylmuramoylalanyl-D-glutamyl-2, 6-diaminopimelate--D-alanyl-D-alanine ligase [Lachnospiraceae bacterium]|jgi:UDP-N-acetylmuramoyl-tripeptide--D-alanyl-D-alanine ligase|nr:UDP-N-acetylmuramoylalanyl-D-glutamyl-2, 6-diaminopimelate--D-alanyl-D-alanine ligase [Lachnospiraceae bacterium]HBI72625.1 UDP-N-acetylmuramoylalanyl-D-glutamyl-2, 6-diaminopimelate--D-alanyl-D-alanine ligase [Lachnospiraceae bacterium]HBY70947.1 UDP-N-acetylmuramoylalanyl-D-glutamyl-2, 6-diaminopimelate--D-alanyl-D-alanine ligase [Lachnospiraceae bacterium]HCA69757.1 UDP-N-acetylmuramoylalanyl-D-glutamyl-2, 6-diaminopimelate--D-alanyl-D-alanine ligase [Lachnospiraceae bacterium]HCM12890.1 
MKNMTLSAIARACNGQLVGEKDCAGKEAAGVVLDSRLVKKDYLFLATVGERTDGHNFIDDVFEKGALAVVCEKAPAEPKGPYILVQNSFEALKCIAKWYRMQLDVKVIGITGSVGKTSTKEFISSVLAQRYTVLKTEGNFNNEVGLPLTILKLRDHHEVAVLEMGISNFGEMNRLSEIAKPDICVITNIGQCHLENLGSRQGILKAKSEIFNYMNENGRVCINGDDDMLLTIKSVKGKKPIKFGFHPSNDVYATDVVSQGLLGSTCRIHVNDKEFQAHIPLPGEHMVHNAMAATAVGTLLHLTCEEIAEGIKAVQSVHGRSNIIQHKKYTIIDDCYNANPVSMKAALDLLSMADTRKTAILGDMNELGSKEQDFHKEVGSYAAAAGVDVLVCIGKLAKNMYEGALHANFIGSLFYYETRDELIAALSSIIQENDTILVKASHSMGFENIVNALLQ